MDFTPCKSLHNEDLEITRNPFDSKDFDKENCPAFSPSIFVKSVSQGSSEKKNKDFRWSIDQLAVLKPADIEEYPYQEYSVSYEREEDEVAAQKAINEYFAKATLPSPWLRNKEHAFKRVTFSPHPPTYFKETSHESNKSSMNSSGDSQSGESKKLVDGCCQTNLTIPPNIDLEKLLGSSLFTFKEESLPAVSKELNVSSLRRKLFSQGDMSPSKEKGNAQEEEHLCVEINGLVSGNSTPKTPRTPNWITSSPFRDVTPNNRLSSSHDSIMQSSFVAEPFVSPVVSPIKDTGAANDDEGTTLELSDESIFYPISSLGDSHLKASDSPDLRICGSSKLAQPKRINTVSIEPYDSLVDIKESTRVAPIEIPGVSPIRLDQDDAMDLSVVSSTKYYAAMNMSELADFSQSVKESTARQFHGMTGLFSPIRGSRKLSESAGIRGPEKGQAGIEEQSEEPDASFDDGGPLDITDLSFPDCFETQNQTVDEDEQSDDVFSAPVVIVSPFPTPKRGILKHTSKRDESKSGPMDDYLQDRFINLEYKLHEVENRLESVENAYEKGQEMPKTEEKCEFSTDGNGQKNYRKKSKSPRQLFANDVVKEVTRLPLKDVANKQTTVKDKYSLPKNQRTCKQNIDIESVVVRADAVLSKAKKVQSSVDGDFELFLEGTFGEGPTAVDDDRESSEVAGITGIIERKDNSAFTYENELLAKGILASHENRFKEYRLTGYRDSFNDSLDLRSRTTMESGEMDLSVFTGMHGDTRVPTPVMNLAGLSIYTAGKENRIPRSLPKPLTSERRWPLDSSKIERRHTWPSWKSQRSTSYHGRSVSPCFPSRYNRAPKSYSFIKQDTANKIRDEWRIRPSSRNGFLSSFR